MDAADANHGNEPRGQVCDEANSWVSALHEASPFIQRPNSIRLSAQLRFSPSRTFYEVIPVPDLLGF